MIDVPDDLCGRLYQNEYEHVSSLDLDEMEYPYPETRQHNFIDHFPNDRHQHQTLKFGW